MRIYPLLIYTIAFLLFSCQDKPDTKTYLSHINNLKLSLEESASVYESIDTAIIRQQLASVKYQIEHLQSFNNITFTKSVTLYKIIKYAFENYLKTYPAVKFELEFTRLQLADLKHDIENNQLNKELAALYFDQEKQSVRVLKLKMDYYSNLVTSNSENYIALNITLEKLADSLNQKNEF